MSSSPIDPSSTSTPTTSTSTAPSTSSAPRCLPCEGLSETLQGVELATERLKIPGWTVLCDTEIRTVESEEGIMGEEEVQKLKLSREFICKNFVSALKVLNDIGEIAEREGHHPDLHLTEYRKVQINVWTHSLEGISLNDILLCEMIDKEVKILYSPKWLKENPQHEATALK